MLISQSTKVSTGTLYNTSSGFKTALSRRSVRPSRLRTRHTSPRSSVPATVSSRQEASSHFSEWSLVSITQLIYSLRIILRACNASIWQLRQPYPITMLIAQSIAAENVIDLPQDMFPNIAPNIDQCTGLPAGYRPLAHIIHDTPVTSDHRTHMLAMAADATIKSFDIE